jgi:hypothetical protein
MRRGSAQVAVEEGVGAPPGELDRGGVEACPRVAAEAVLGISVTKISTSGCAARMASTSVGGLERLLLKGPSECATLAMATALERVTDV